VEGRVSMGRALREEGGTVERRARSLVFSTYCGEGGWVGLGRDENVLL